jgi:hypothetical protein
VVCAVTKLLYFFGDSHCWVYRKAAHEAGRTDFDGGQFLGARTLWREFFSADADGVRFLGQAAENFKVYSERTGIEDLRACRQSLVVSMGLAAAAFYGSRTWLRLYSIAPDDRQKRMIVSEAVLAQMVLDVQRHVLAFYEWLHEHGLIFAVVAAPRPQRRHPVIELLGADKVLRLVEAFERPVREKLAELGHPIVDLPQTVDDDGFLKEEFWGEDPSHGNTAYGLLLIEQLDRLRQFDGAELNRLKLLNGAVLAHARQRDEARVAESKAASPPRLAPAGPGPARRRLVIGPVVTRKGWPDSGL